MLHIFVFLAFPTSVLRQFILYVQCLSRSTAVEIVNSSKVLQAETKMLLDGKLLVRSCWGRAMSKSHHHRYIPFTPRVTVYLADWMEPYCLGWPQLLDASGRD